MAIKARTKAIVVIKVIIRRINPFVLIVALVVILQKIVISYRIFSRLQAQGKQSSYD